MKIKIAIVASLFNHEYVDGMIASAMPLLKGYDVEVVRVPGAFEIPLAAQRAIRRKKVKAVIALGVIWKGKTLHAHLLATSVTEALMKISLENDTPVIHQVITVITEKEARERCFGKKLNRGREAAEAVNLLLSGETK